jgi:hypothetical protein
MLKKASFIVSFGLLLFVFAGLNSCSIKYSFTGANISPLVKTFSVAYFPNRAKLVNPNLSQQLTESLKEKILKQTPYNEVAEAGDIEFSGVITGYDVRPIAVQKEDLASQNRLTVTISLKYTNNKDHEQDFDKTFSAFEDYDSQRMLSDAEEEIVHEILVKLLEDIFNATIAKW